jgi:hypothetical protein
MLSAFLITLAVAAPQPVAPLSSKDFPTIRQPQATVDPLGRVVIVFGV